jgi:hypothetical protein
MSTSSQTSAASDASSAPLSLIAPLVPRGTPSPTESNGGDIGAGGEEKKTPAATATSGHPDDEGEVLLIENKKVTPLSVHRAPVNLSCARLRVCVCVCVCAAALCLVSNQI